MEVTRYIIRAMYLEGPRKDTSYFILKYGVCTDNLRHVPRGETYDTYKACEKACKKHSENNLRKHNNGIYYPRTNRPCALCRYEPYSIIYRTEI